MMFFIYIFRSDPGPELLQPISASDERLVTSVANDYLDLDDRLLFTSASQARGNDDNVTKIRKKGRVSGVTSHANAADENIIPRQAAEIDYHNSYESGGSEKSLYAGPNRSAGYVAPVGMLFIPMCSACDESTDEE